MKKGLLFSIIGLAAVGLVACNGNDEKEESSEVKTSNVQTSQVTNESKTDATSAEASSSKRVNPDAETTIFLAGDSTVKTYEDKQYIGGWGQYLDLFLDDNITVKNCAQGGRSSRSFINEGRLYDTKENNFNYTFTENGGHSIEEDIKAGDYLFIQFGHNDDDTKSYEDTQYRDLRFVPLGTPDGNGIFPTTAPTNKQSTSTENLPADTGDKAKAEIAKYGDNYYAYDSTGASGTYKGYLKEYIDFAREKGAIPVIVTPVARVSFKDGKIVGGAGKHGPNFEYVTACKQLAEETDTMLIDLFTDSKTMLETATQEFADFLMALKPNELTGEWPYGYDSTYNDSTLGYTGIEATHYNKIGAYLEAGKVAEHLIDFIASDTKYNENKEKIAFANSVLTTPEKYVCPSNNMSKAKIDAVYSLFTKVNPKDPNYSYKDPATVDALIEKLANDYSDLTADNYIQCGEEIKAIKKEIFTLNIDDRNTLSNKDLFDEMIANYEFAYESYAPKPSDIALLQFSTTGDITTAQEITVKTTKGENFTFKAVGTSDSKVTVSTSTAAFKYNNQNYSVANRLSLNGTAKFGTSRYVELTLAKKSRITVYCNGGTKDDGTSRELALVKSTDTSTILATCEAPKGNVLTTIEDVEAGTYYLGSTAKGVNIYAIIVEYFE
ncbi:MAG: hypothetical protein K6E20_02010 [Acholeplasmatales bacterium]|nr:hypothetical protein [Acholeplasmatales bacterium]